jgi:hypothetical protein
MPNLVTLNRDRDRYSDADTFDPTRFLDDNTDAYTSALSATHMQRDHFHYGFGRRLCQGIHLAEDSLFIATSRILWAFDIKQLPGHPLSMADKICELFTSQSKSLSLLPSLPLPLYPSLFLLSVCQRHSALTSMERGTGNFTTRPKPFKISITYRDSAVVAIIKDEIQRTGADLETM